MSTVCINCNHTNRNGVLFCTQCGSQISERPHLLVLYGPDQGAMFTVDQSVMTIGRNVGNDIVLKDPTVSSYHAILHYDGQRLTIEDRRSRNGTRVNGELIDTRSVLRNEYLVKVGNTLLRVRMRVPIPVRSVNLLFHPKPTSHILDR